MKIIFTSNISNTQDKTLALVFSQNTFKELNKLEIFQDIDFNNIITKFELKLDKSFFLELNAFNGSKKVILACIGEDEKITSKTTMELGGKLYNYTNDKTLTLYSFLNEEAKKDIVAGLQLKGWDFSKYITSSEDHSKKLEEVIIVGSEVDFSEANAIVQGVNFARDLISEPSNELYPQNYAQIIKNDLAPLGVEVEILGRKELEKLQMGSLLSVSKGSLTEPQVVVMKYNGTDTKKQPIALIGKGVTFDTGGYSLKPPMAMIGMKKDMGGSAAVVGTIKTLALRKAKVNVIGIIGLVENMISATATKPGDIVKSMSGKTIEVLNTDAEGRLVLADILWYAKETFQPDIMINLATLTGAIIVSLGVERAGMFCNNETLAAQLEQSADATGELLWKMPLGEEYAKYLKSSVADLQNISLTSSPGSIFGAMFLKEFVGKTKWAHLDIAGTADTPTELPLFKKGARGYGVMLLNDLIKNNYEG